MAERSCGIAFPVKCPEPHSGGSGRKHRKDKPFHGLQFPHFPHFTLPIPQIPRIPVSFLQFPAITGELAIYKERYLAERFGTPDGVDRVGMWRGGLGRAYL